MGRPPCCDNTSMIKKGPWTPEEDIILVSYIQQHGPGNWRSVPTNTGLMRCSKSCRLRWTNYLRPGIKRGNFTTQEEGMIIHLQALLGNKWAAIASYLPQRTDNDIKNYWNTHLKKRLRKVHTNMDGNSMASSSDSANSTHHLMKGPDILDPTPNHCSSTTTYASSTENISKLLEAWIGPPQKASMKQENTTTTTNRSIHQENCGGLGDVDTMFSLENMNGVAWNNEKSSSDSTLYGSYQSTITDEETKQRLEGGQRPLSLIEKWIFDDAADRVDGLTDMSCCLNVLF